MKQNMLYLMRTYGDIFKMVHQHSYHQMKEHNIYPGQPKLLALIKDNEGITQKELSGKNCVKPASITEMLQKLEANDFVYRVPDENDKRIMRVYLTKKGKKFGEYSEKYHTDMMNHIFHGFSEEELITLTRLMDKMKDNLKDMDS